MVDIPSFPIRKEMFKVIRAIVIPCLLLIASLSVLSSGCGEKGSNFAHTSAGPTTNTTTFTAITLNPPIILTWDAPTTYSDGSFLDPSRDLQEYRIYYRVPSEDYSPLNSLTVPFTETSITISEFVSHPSRTYGFVVTAVDNANVESYHSNELFKVIQ